MGSHTMRPQDSETRTSIQRIGNTLAQFWTLLCQYLHFIDPVHYMQDDNTLKCIKEKIARSQAGRR